MESRPFGAGRVTYGLHAPAPRFHQVPILPIKSASWYDLVLLNSRVFGVEVYYDGERNQPITDAQREDPDTYQSLFAKKWQGWISVRPYHTSKLYLLCITPVTVACVPQLGDESFDLRGWCVGVQRKDGEKRGKLLGRWNNRRAELERLPHPPDVAEVLERMWLAPLKKQSSPSSSERKTDRDTARRIDRDTDDPRNIPI